MKSRHANTKTSTSDSLASQSIYLHRYQASITQPHSDVIPVRERRLEE